jgi:hypothetical protein
MISPTTVEREIRFLLPVLWSYFKEQVKWPAAEQWLEMAIHWDKGYVSRGSGCH